MNNISDLELDAVREICFIGAANAATAISGMTGIKITMAVPKVEFMPVTGAMTILPDHEMLVCGVYCRIFGDLSGGFLLTIPRESAGVLADILLGAGGIEKTAVQEKKAVFLGEMERSAILEAGNIVAGSFVGALSKMLNKNILISVPQFAFDMLGAVIDFILIGIAKKAEYCMIMEIVFKDEANSINGNFFILPDPDFLDLLIKASGVEREG